jgi:autoinducer 2-degrading protein
MVTRIVKMTFDTTKAEDFKTLMLNNAYLIRAFDGCEYLRILQDNEQPNVFFTYSYWQSDSHLEAYRKSELFDKIWSTVKPNFAAKPEAWSTDIVIELPNERN